MFLLKIRRKAEKMREDKKNYLKLYSIQESKIKRLKEMMILYPERKENYKKDIEKSLNLRAEIETKIKSLDNDILSEVLFQKYVFGKTLEQIGDLLNYSERQIERFHIKALDEIKI